MSIRIAIGLGLWATLGVKVAGAYLVSTALILYFKARRRLV